SATANGSPCGSRRRPARPLLRRCRSRTQSCPGWLLGTLRNMPRVRVALCQINTVVGDLEGNAAKVLDAYERAEAQGCDIAVFPELAITGYPPEDLLLKPGFVRANREALEKVAAATGRCAAVVGFVDEDRDLFNAAAVCADGRVAGTYHKRNL